MGINESLMHKKIEKYNINESENNKLMQIFSKYIYNGQDFISKVHLQQILDLSDPELFDIIFLLFKEKYQRFEILKFKDIKDIYFSFLSNAPKIKITFISFLIFKTDEKIKQKEINAKFKKIFQKSELFDFLNNYYSTIKQSFNDNNNKISNADIKDIYITRNDFVKYCNKEPFFNNFRFIDKKFVGSSRYDQKTNKLNFICDCDCTKENNIKDNLDSMKRGYDNLTSATKNILYLTDFIKALKNENINEKMIKLVFEYLNKYTQKKYCSFNDIKYIFSNLNYSVPLTDKKRFLFKMIVTICGKDNKLTEKQINEFLDFDSPVNTINEKNENNIDKNNQKNDEININSEENLNEIKINEEGEINTDSNKIEQNSNTNDNLDEINTDTKNSEKINDENEKIILDENNTENNLKLYGEEEFMNDFDDKFIKIISHLDNFGLLPYKLFKAQTNDKKIKRRLIKDILKNRSIDNHEIYLKESFDYCNTFYIVDINFWNSLMNEQEEIPDYINNSRIAEEIIIIKEEDKFYQEENNERMREFEEKERKEMEKKQKKKKKKPNEEKDDKNKENKEGKDEKKEEETGLNKIENMITKNGKLKKGLKYKKDFIILCDELYNIIKNNYKLDYEIRLKKIKTVYLITNKKNKEEQSKQNDIKKEEAKNDEMKKEDIKEEENNKKKDKEEENINKEDIEKKRVDEEEYKNKEKKAIELLDKYIVDEENGLISKILKDNNNNYISTILDFYPIKVYENSFGHMVRMVEKAKILYDDIAEKKRIKQLSKREQKKIQNKKEKEEEKLVKKIRKVKGLLQNYEIELRENIISQEEYNAKRSELKAKYSEVFQKPEKTPDNYEVDIKLSEFIDYFQKYKNTLLLENSNNILTFFRTRTCKEIVQEILMNNPQLKQRKFDIYYYLFNSKNLFKPNDNYTLGQDANEDFISVIIDIHNENDQSFYQLLQDKEKLNDSQLLNPEDFTNEEEKKENKENKEKKDEKDEKEKDKKDDDKKKKEKKEKKDKKEKKKLTEEEKREKKEKEQQEKLEKEKFEKERKEKEKEHKRLEKQQREEWEKKRKEEEKKQAQLEKEMRAKEKEENKKRKQLEKEREREREKRKEREKYKSPPYGINNYGNTCYFNSVNQIFFNLPILQQIFLDPRIDYFVNKTNKFGHQGKFFEIYKSLYWIKASKVGDTVINLKKMVGKLKIDFDNNDQQDANEYLNFVLDNLHEELNLHSEKRYIEEKDDIFKHNKDSELGEISWANHLKRNTSFIDSIFMFQLKSNLKCRKCNTIKFNFETNYIIDLPLSLCKMVTVEVNLYRLPFRYKLYYNKINEKFNEYINKKENKNLSIIKNLWNYYTNVLSIKEKEEQCIKLHFSFDLEREKKMIDITKMLRGIKPLELEPENYTETINNENLNEYKINHLTDLITYSHEKNKIIFPNSSIDKFVNINDNIILNIYEVLNTNGMSLLYEEENKNNGNLNDLILYSYLIKKSQILNLDDVRNKIKQTNYNINNNNSKGILALKDFMIYFPTETINKDTLKTRKIRSEFAIPIFHYYRSNKESTYLFRDFYHSKIKQFPVQYIVLNNLYNTTGKQLYEYIWYLNTLYMNHPNKNIKEFWWNKINSIDYSDNNNNNNNDINNNNNNNKKLNINNDKNNINDKEINKIQDEKNNNIINNIEENNKDLKDDNNKKDEEVKENKHNINWCYPFVLRYTEIPKEREDYHTNLIHCGLCPWHTFCPGCIINPNEKLEKISSDIGIVVDWCTTFINEEFIIPNFTNSREIDNQKISENLPFNDKEQNYQSVKDCFNLFFVEENLEDPLYCHKCQGPEDFSKKYEINKLPYVLILSLKRFKFNQNSNFKLRQMITYPLYDLELRGKKYDLYGVINHYGSINSGHYTCIIKKKDQWVMCDDSNVYQIEEKRVMHANAYILFYVSKDSPYTNDYFRFMKSLMNNVIIQYKNNDKKEKDKEVIIQNDKNFFRGEPVKTNYGEGYVMEDNIDNFPYDENYDIYDDLKIKDDLRIEKIIKKQKEEDERNKKENDKEDKDKNEGKENESKDNDDQNKENKENNENKDNNKKEEQKENNENNKNEEKNDNMNKTEEQKNNIEVDKNESNNKQNGENQNEKQNNEKEDININKENKEENKEVNKEQNKEQNQNEPIEENKNKERENEKKEEEIKEENMIEGNIENDENIKEENKDENNQNESNKNKENEEINLINDKENKEDKNEENKENEILEEIKDEKTEKENEKKEENKNEINETSEKMTVENDEKENKNKEDNKIIELSEEKKVEITEKENENKEDKKEEIKKDTKEENKENEIIEISKGTQVENNENKEENKDSNGTNKLEDQKENKEAEVINKGEREEKIENNNNNIINNEEGNNNNIIINNKENNDDKDNNNINNGEKDYINEIILNDENPNKINIIEDDDKKKEKEEKEMKELYKNFVRVKFDIGEGWLFKDKVKKYNYLKTEKQREDELKEKKEKEKREKEKREKEKKEKEKKDKEKKDKEKKEKEKKSKK